MKCPIEQIGHLMAEQQHQAALDVCSSWLAQSPDTAEAHHLYGILMAQQGDIHLAILSLQKALQLDPNQPVYHSNLSNAYKALGNYHLAQQHLHQALRINPNYSEAHNNLGCLFYKQAQINDAIQCFQKAIRLSPNNWEAHFNLGNCLATKNQYSQAIDHYKATLHYKPDHIVAIQNLSMAYIACEEYQQALPLLEQTARLNPTHAELQNQLATTYLVLGKVNPAIAAFTETLRLNPQHAEAHHNLAVLYLRADNRDLALQHFTQTLKLQPNNDTARHMAAALSKENHINHSQAPRQYVADLFDQYAPIYNHHMQEQLNYKTPLLLREAFNDLLPTHKIKAQRILDLGCGTGLCSIYFRDLALFLVGIDISLAMLHEARKINGYDGLCQGDLLNPIPGFGQQCFDIILAADVLVYLGDLKPLFNQIQSTLTSSGLFGFTIESLPDENNEDYQLQPTGRYAHHIDYLEKLAKQFNFIFKLKKSIALRTHLEEKINGYLCILQGAT